MAKYYHLSDYTHTYTDTTQGTNMSEIVIDEGCYIFMTDPTICERRNKDFCCDLFDTCRKPKETTDYFSKWKIYRKFKTPYCQISTDTCNMNSNVEIEKIIQNGPATVVFFSDGDKVVVKRNEDDQDDIYAAVAYCWMKKIYKNNSHFKKIVDDHVVYQDNSPSNKRQESDKITNDILRELFSLDDEFK